MMLYRILLIAAAILCTLSNVLIVQADKQTPQLVQIKDIVCVLVLSGVKKEDLDKNTLGKLQQYNVNLEDLNTSTIGKDCHIPDSFENTTHKKSFASISTEQQWNTTQTLGYIIKSLKADQLRRNDDITTPVIYNYYLNLTKIPKQTDDKKKRQIIQTDDDLKNGVSQIVILKSDEITNDVKIRKLDKINNIFNLFSIQQHKLENENEMYRKALTSTIAPTINQDVNNVIHVNEFDHDLMQLLKKYKKQISHDNPTTTTSTTTLMTDVKSQYEFQNGQPNVLLNKIIGQYLITDKPIETTKSTTTIKQDNFYETLIMLSDILATKLKPKDNLDNPKTNEEAVPINKKEQIHKDSATMITDNEDLTKINNIKTREYINMIGNLFWTNLKALNNTHNDKVYAKVTELSTTNPGTQSLRESNIFLTSVPNKNIHKNYVENSHDVENIIPTISLSQMYLPPNLIQDIVDKVKNVVVKDLKINSPLKTEHKNVITIMETTTTTTTITTPSPIVTTIKPTFNTITSSPSTITSDMIGVEDQNLMREFLQMFKQFKHERKLSSKTQTRDNTKTYPEQIRKSPAYLTTYSARVTPKEMYKQTNMPIIETIAEENSIPLIQSNFNEIPPLFTKGQNVPQNMFQHVNVMVTPMSPYRAIFTNQLKKPIEKTRTRQKYNQQDLYKELLKHRSDFGIRLKDDTIKVNKYSAKDYKTKIELPQNFRFKGHISPVGNFNDISANIAEDPYKNYPRNRVIQQYNTIDKNKWDSRYYPLDTDGEYKTKLNNYNTYVDRYQGKSNDDNLSKIKDIPLRESVQNVVNSLDEEIEARQKMLKVNKRQQVPLRPNKMSMMKSYDAHFEDFLKTQQKVNDMLEKILSMKTPERVHTVTSTEVL